MSAFTKLPITAALAAILLLSAGAGESRAQAPTQGAAQGPAATPEVTRAVVAADVREREPVGEGVTFSPGVGTLYFYTVLEGDFPQQRIEHVWLRNGEEVARVPLTVSGPRWRTWSTKEVTPGSTGEWSARVVDAGGNELASVDFQVSG